MILNLVRIPLTILLAWTFYRELMRHAELTGGGAILLLAYGLTGAIILAILWAPVIGDKLSDPLTSALSNATSLPSPPNRLVRWISQLQQRGWHRPALLLVFVEGIRHPNLPQPALLGLRSCRPGSLLERCFAREVYKYNNIQNCLHAYSILKERHGICPPLHQHPEVNLAILNLTRQPAPEPAKVQVVPKPVPVTPPRNPRIQIFDESQPDQNSH